MDSRLKMSGMTEGGGDGGGGNGGGANAVVPVPSFRHSRH